MNPRLLIRDFCWSLSNALISASWSLDNIYQTDDYVCTKMLTLLILFILWMEHQLLLQVAVEPLNRLVESLLLGELDLLLAEVTTHCESVLDSTVEVDLVRLLELLPENLLGLVTFLLGEDAISFWYPPSAAVFI